MKATAVFVAVMPDGTERYAAGKGRQSACMRLTGMRAAPAIAAGIIKSITPAPAVAPTRRGAKG